MARVTRSDLKFALAQAEQALGLDPVKTLWLQHSATGWHVYKEAGPHGAVSPLGECLTAREALCLLQGLSLAPTLQAPSHA